VKSFAYTAVDDHGRPVSGTVEAADWQAAQELLAARGLRECVLTPEIPTGPKTKAVEPLPALSASDAVELASYLSQLAKAGLPLGGGLRAVAKDLSSGNVPTALEALASRLESGHSLESALESLGSRLPRHVRELMVVGARSGHLAETLDKVLAHERGMDDLGRQLWHVVAYPITLMAFFIAWLLFATMWLIPQMQVGSLLVDMGDFYTTPRQWVPASSRRLIEFAHVTPSLILAAIGATLLVVGIARVTGGARLVSRLLAQVPLFGPAWWYRSLIEFSGLLAVFLKQQLPLDDALRLVSLSARDAAIRAACAKAAGDVAAGRELSQCLSGNSLFPATLVNLIDWGQRHTALADSLDSARQMYLDRFELQLQLMRLILPPIAFLLVGGSALFVAYGLLGSVTSMVKLLTDLT
jgi:type II secretory pathway component PulF